MEGVSVEELRAALEEVEEKKPTQRLLLAILYKQGPSVPMIAEWFDMRADTIYRWFSEMEREPLLEAVYDDNRPGRPAKLSDEQRAAFEGALQESPAKVGIDAAAWTPTLARRYLRDAFGVEYTLRHVRRLMHDIDGTRPSRPPDKER